MIHCAIVAMGKEPIPGAVKTRLSPPLSHRECSTLYEAMLFDTIDTISSLKYQKKYLFFDPPQSRYFDRFQEMGIAAYPQEGAELGEKMGRAAQFVAHATGTPVVIIGTDIPLLTPSIITRAVSMLEDTDAVIGPCEDGGYYLIGLKTFTDIPFRCIPWSTEEVTVTTISRLAANGLSCALTETLFDIDIPNDIEKHISYLKENPGRNTEKSRFSKEAMRIYPELKAFLRDNP